MGQNLPFVGQQEPSRPKSFRNPRLLVHSGLECGIAFAIDYSEATPFGCSPLMEPYNRFHHTQDESMRRRLLFLFLALATMIGLPSVSSSAEDDLSGFTLQQLAAAMTAGGTGGPENLLDPHIFWRRAQRGLPCGSL